eukprot:6166336-Lingulodinium_polyedra.AAC.1
MAAQRIAEQQAALQAALQAASAGVAAEGQQQGRPAVPGGQAASQGPRGVPASHMTPQAAT